MSADYAIWRSVYRANRTNRLIMATTIRPCLVLTRMRLQLNLVQLLERVRMSKERTGGRARSGSGSSYQRIQQRVRPALSLCTRWRSVGLGLTLNRFIFAPSIDGDLIPASPHELLEQGLFAKIPFISGSVKDE